MKMCVKVAKRDYGTRNTPGKKHLLPRILDTSTPVQPTQVAMQLRGRRRLSTFAKSDFELQCLKKVIVQRTSEAKCKAQPRINKHVMTTVVNILVEINISRRMC